MEKNATLEAMREVVTRIPIVDTHEHLDTEEAWLKERAGISHFFTHYASCDLVSAGMPVADMQRVKSGQADAEEEWKLLEPYWPKARNTSYCRAIDIAIRDLYGLPGLNRETYPSILEKMKETQRPGWYHEVLKDKANIEISVIAKWEAGDRSLFVASPNLDEFAIVANRSGLDALMARIQQSVYSLSDLVAAMESTLDKLVADGAVSVKCGLAYARPILFDNATEHEAEIIFNRLSGDRSSGLPWPESKPFQDYVVHRIIRSAIARNLPIQIHTGIQEGNGNYVAHSDPTLLTNIFLMYPSARFDVFHAGFPYSRPLGVLAKNFANVYPDMCWMHIIGAASARSILDEWLDLVPANKILGFGGDYKLVEGVYGHSVIARENVARVLADRVERGDQTAEEAGEIARRILSLNARELFRLDSSLVQKEGAGR